mmetsp:Transcript_28685/g.72726  ORF Transcript_28685/g.72726 Transcript_28685/m.72726 type:complete len:218 (+) Transcript_28685:848-1501(+)
MSQKRMPSSGLQLRRASVVDMSSSGSNFSKWFHKSTRFLSRFMERECCLAKASNIFHSEVWPSAPTLIISPWMSFITSPNSTEIFPYFSMTALPSWTSVVTFTSLTNSKHLNNLSLILSDGMAKPCPLYLRPNASRGADAAAGFLSSSSSSAGKPKLYLHSRSRGSNSEALALRKALSLGPEAKLKYSQTFLHRTILPCASFQSSFSARYTPSKYAV